MASETSRRSFLLAGAGLALAAACGGDDGGRRATQRSRTRTSPPSDVSLVVATYVHVAGGDERVTLAFVREEGPAETPEEASVSFVQVGRGAPPEAAPSAPVSARRHDDGVPLPYLLVRHRFEAPGFYEARTTYEGRPMTAALTVVPPDATKVPIAGRPLPKVPTPTVADARGVNPICTRNPPCPLHDVSLDAALGERRPIALLFATPALCQSRLCGPVLDNLLSWHDAFSGRVRFLHVEIFRDTTASAVVPAVEEFGLESEPFLFLAGADGVVRERLDNAFDRREARAALQRITA